MCLLTLLTQQPSNETKTEITLTPLGIVLIIALIILIIVGIFVLLLNKDNDVEEQEETHKKSFPWGIIITISIGFILLLIPITLKQTSSPASKETSLITRNITTSDYTYTTSQDLTSYQLTIVPKKDINSCTISLTLYDKNDKKLFSDTITKYELKKNDSYTYTFEFGFLNSLSGNYIKFNVTGECYK